MIERRPAPAANTDGSRGTLELRKALARTTMGEGIETRIVPRSQMTNGGRRTAGKGYPLNLATSRALALRMRLKA